MAALSDYLESGLLNHIFRGQEFPKPSSIAIALTSDVPLESDTGETIPELPSGIYRADIGFSTNYKRLDLGNPKDDGDDVWNNVGIDEFTIYQVSGTSNYGLTDGINGYFYPLYLNESIAADRDSVNATQQVRFVEFPGVDFFSPNDLFESGVYQNPGYEDYNGNGFIKNGTQFIFDTALEEWGWISGVAIVDSAEYGSGNVLMYSKLTNPRYVYVGDNIKFDVNSLEISLQ